MNNNLLNKISYNIKYIDSIDDFFTKVKFDFKTYFKIFKMSFFGDFNRPGMGGGGGGTGKTRYLSMILLGFASWVSNF